MKPLARPIRQLLDADSSEAEIQEVWRGVQGRRRARRRAQPIFTWLRASAAVLALAAATLLLSRSWRPAAGPLHDSSGRALNVLGGAGPSLVTLSDGSSIELSEGAELQVLSNDSATFACVLRRGRGTFEVTPGGPRHWHVESGTVHVEVTGTRFTVERAEQETRVSVTRGTVVVRGERVPDGVQKLSAGERVVVPALRPGDPGSAVAPASAAAPPSAMPKAIEPDQDPTDKSSAPAQSVTPPPPSPMSSLEFADEQRRRGDVRGAIQTLRAVMAHAGDAPQRAIAAFTMGKLELDQLGQARAAAAAFRECLRLSPPGAVAEDALARLVQAEAKAGNAARANAAAAEYERRYPMGRRLTDVRRWSAPR